MERRNGKEVKTYGENRMKHSIPHYDVVIVGASVGGATAAMLFAQQGLRVALVERSQDIDAFKIVCTHFIQGSALPIIKRFGLKLIAMTGNPDSALARSSDVMLDIGVEKEACSLGLVPTAIKTSACKLKPK